MDLLQISALRELLTYRGDPSVSIYMPTIRAGREVKQNSIRFKNIVQSVEDDIEKRGMGKKQRKEFLAPLEDMIVNDKFWGSQADGLAVFYSGQELLAYRLPLGFDQKYFVNDRYYVRPLLPMFVENERFFVLTLDLSSVELYAGTKYNVGEMELEEIPVSMEEYLKFEDPERRLEFHNTSSPSSKGQKGVFHQHLPGEDEKEQIRQFFQRIDQGVMERIGGDNAPLVLMGAAHLLPIYQEANAYPRVVGSISRGNPHNLKPKEIHQRAWEEVEPIIHREINDLVEKFHILQARDQATNDIHEILPAAYHGKIETLMASKSETLWGTFDPSSGKVNLHEENKPDNKDLMELAAVHTLSNGGEVYNLGEEHMPENSPKIAAIQRY